MTRSPSIDAISQAVLSQQQTARQLPPVDKWSPAFSGDLDMRIDREGEWYYQGDRMTRKSLVTLFSSILMREGDDYFLVTPVEKWRITVDEQPFVAVILEYEDEQGAPTLRFQLNDGSSVLLRNPDGFQLQDTGDASAGPRPLIQVRNNLWGLLNRNVFYQLVDMAVERDGEFGFYSGGNWYSLGQIP